MSDGPTSATTAAGHAVPVNRWLRFAGPVSIIVLALANLGWWTAVAQKWIAPRSLLPSAPGTTLLFFVVGIAFALVTVWPSRIGVRRVAALLAGAAGILCFHVFLGGLLDQPPVWERWIGPADLVIRGYRVGRMSGYTAALMLVTLFAFLVLYVGGPRQPRLARVGLWVAGANGLLALLLTMSYAAGNPLYASTNGIAISPSTAIGLLILNAGFVVGSPWAAEVSPWFRGGPDSTDTSSREQRWLVAVLVAAGLVLAIAGVLFLSVQTERQLRRALEEMQAMSNLKAGQVAQWRRERIGDARTIMAIPQLEEFAQLMIAGKASATDRRHLTAWFGKLRANYGYSAVLLLDEKMNPVATEPAETGFSPDALRPLSSLRGSADITELPPSVDRSGNLHWNLLVPLRLAGAEESFGAILLETNIDQFLLPIIRAWPRDNRTGQSMLWYRDGDKLYSLGGYRVLPDFDPAELRPFAMVRSLTDPGSQSFLTQAVRGETASSGLGVDHRGINVVGLALPIPESVWYISSRMDASEVYAPLRRYAAGAAGAVLAVLGLTGVVTFALWRHRQKELLAARLTAELEQKRLAARLGTVMRHARDIIFLVDADLHFVDANQQAVETYGWTRAEFLRMTIADLSAPELRGDLAPALARITSPGGATVETLHVRRDGTTFPVEISSRLVDLEGRSQIFAIVRDITDRKRAEHERSVYQSRLHELAERLQRVREEESTRIARVVHDELGQQLTGVKMDLRWIERRLEKIPDPAAGAVLDKVVSASALVDDTVKTVQRVAAELRPAILDQLGLFAALRHEAGQFAQRAGVACQVLVPETTAPPSRDLATACYRIVQEALTNVARHAAATAVEIECHAGPVGFVIEVRDNGRGIAPAPPTEVRSLGLLGMEERARAHGGTVVIQPGRAGGTIVRASFPTQSPLSEKP